MNTKRFVIASVAVFVFLYLYNWLVHGVLLAPKYEEVAHLFRSQADFMAHMPWMIAGYILMAIAFCRLFIGGYEDRGIGEGVRFGLWAGLLIGSIDFISYAVQPISLKLGVDEFIAEVVMAVGAGVVAALTYKAESASETTAAPADQGPYQPGG